MSNPRKDYHQARYNERKAKGLCLCGKKAVSPYVKCRACRKKQKEWNHSP